MCMALLVMTGHAMMQQVLYRLIGQQVTDIAFQTTLEFTSDRIYLLLYFISLSLAYSFQYLYSSSASSLF